MDRIHVTFRFHMYIEREDLVTLEEHLRALASFSRSPRTGHRLRNDFRDTVKAFIAERCVVNVAERVASHELREAFYDWLQLQPNEPLLGERQFANTLKALGYFSAPRDGVRYWFGLSLKVKA